MTGGGEKTVLWTAAEVVTATSGDTFGDWRVNGVSIDSCSVEAGDLFIAISGPNHDGHDFVAAAFEKGAAAAIVSRGPEEIAALSPFADRLLRVDDTMVALERLAIRARARTDAEIVAVTGSVGKTGTKESLRRALEAQDTTTATAGNLNNHWGLPLSLARMPRETKFGIFELGMSAPGEIRHLSGLVRPHVAVITAVADAHREFFASVEKIADAKAEIFFGLEPGGTAILNADSEVALRLAEAAAVAGVEHILWFGEAVSADFRLIDCRLDFDGSDVVAEAAGRRIEYRLSVAGRHWVSNSLAVLAAVHAVGADVDAAAATFTELQNPPGRGRRHHVALAGGEMIVIDESYNASPASTKAAIGVLGQYRPSGEGRKIAVLGDMLELGEDSDELHAALVPVLVENGVDLVFTAGQYTSAIWEALPAALRGGHASSADKVMPLVSAAVRRGDVVLVKGSNGSRTMVIVDALLALGQSDGMDAPRRANGE